jgi:hypothetical protein
MTYLQLHGIDGLGIDYGEALPFRRRLEALVRSPKLDRSSELRAQPECGVGRGEVGVGAGVIESGSLSRPAGLEVTTVVLHEMQ